MKACTPSRAQVHHVVGHRRAGILVSRHDALLELAVEQGLPSAIATRGFATMRATSASTSSSSASGAATRLSAGLGIDVGDLELAARRRCRRAPADHTHSRHGKAVFRPDRPTSSTSATYVRTPQPRPQTNPELRNLDPNRTLHLSRPAEDCEECPALAGVRNLAKVSLWGARSGLKNGVVVALRRRRAMVLRGRNLAGRWGRVRALHCCRRWCLAEHAD